jgi:hypothetical protein
MVDNGNKCIFQTVLPSTDLTSGTSTKEYGDRFWYVGAAGLAGGTGISSRTMVGTVHAARAYSRVLTDEELTWNRIIDDYRFFGEVSGVLPTNSVVVATVLEGCEGREPNGMYMPCGWTFKMDDSALRTIDDKDYEFAGYVLETWDPETKSWTNPVTNMQSTSWTSPISGVWPSVRLTWMTKVVRGIIPVPDVDDYVQNGLLLHLDGFRNAGSDAPHSTSSTEWHDIAKGGSALIVHASEDGSDWTDDGYFFNGRTLVKMNNEITLFTTTSVQIACNVDTQAQTLTMPSLLGSTDYRDLLNIYWINSDDMLRFKVGEYIAGEMTATYGNAWDGKYITGICTGEKRSFFQTVLPRGWTDFVRNIGTLTVTVGGACGHLAQTYDDWYLTGEVKNVRIYDRALSDAELEQNRAVDEVRQAHKPNVEVADGSCGAMVEAPGLYAVQGTWTFSATNVVDKFGCHRTVTGYTLEPAMDGVWGEPVRYQGSTYTHKVDDAPGFVRLTWKLSPRGMRIIVQ